ncbi:hypothetical protein ZWY2020_024712 [Hordeum vulgare]|nr:hypothetical protein ZWY2020_024712 [Hordeum vulgare]
MLSWRAAASSPPVSPRRRRRPPSTRRRCRRRSRSTPTTGAARSTSSTGPPPRGGNLRPIRRPSPAPSTSSASTSSSCRPRLLLAHHDPTDPASSARPPRAPQPPAAANPSTTPCGLRVHCRLRRPADEAFHLLVDALCDHRRVDEAHHLCLGGRAAAAALPPGTKTHNLLLRGWAKARAWARLRQHWLDMDARGVAMTSTATPSTWTPSQSGEALKAVKLFKEMKQNASGRHRRVQHRDPCRRLAEGVDFAVRMYRQMIEAGCRPNTATFNTIVKLLCKEGEGLPAKDGHICHAHKEVWRWGFFTVFFVWKTMEEQGLTPDAFAYNTLIDALLEKGMVDLARKYDEEMSEGALPKPRKELGTQLPGAESDSDNALSGVI